MRQKSIGEVLRTARESQGLNFVDLQRATKIQAKYLQALEYNNFEAIPDPEYTLLFLQTYAQALDLDADVLVDAYQNNRLVVYYEEGEEEEMASELKRSYKVKKKRKGSYLPLVYLLLAAAFIVIFVSYMLHHYMESRPQQTETTTSYSLVSPSSTSSEPVVEPSSSTAASSETKLAISGGGDALQVQLPQSVAPVQITVRVKDVTSWISVSESDLADGVLLSPEHPTVTTTLAEGTSQSVIVLGVVQGVEVLIGEQVVDTSTLTSHTATISLVVE